jgi:multidrug efflux system membrane fusion protein
MNAAINKAKHAAREGVSIVQRLTRGVKASRLVAVGLIAVAALWIGSGYIFHDEPGHAAIRPADQAEKLFRVSVLETQQVDHSRKLVLSGRTEADHKMMALARTSGLVLDLNVKRGDQVKQGDVIARLSDEAREAQVAQARALVAQRKAELDAKRRLAESGAVAKLDLANIEAQAKAADALLAAADAEAERGAVVAPWSGIITDVPVQPGQSLSIGKEVAQIVALDPMLAVVEVAERKLAGVKVGENAQIRLVTGEVAEGKIRFVSKSATATTRTYRVEVLVPNADGAIPDGITAEVTLKLKPEPSTRIPRSALTFSSTGELGVRTVDAQNKVAFVPVSVAEDDQAFMWIFGVPDRGRVIVQGQDFVREGQVVTPVPADAAAAAPDKTAAN